MDKGSLRKLSVPEAVLRGVLSGEVLVSQANIEDLSQLIDQSIILSMENRFDYSSISNSGAG
ncbi:hypothetical protein [Gimesia maris]|jgi:hypothetical protein|uniref:hypothetical protein n=1 Tax=Gimesia maris TaxID=122 RepID=UPI0001541C94|nr:hypothetical protein [Gimesia maris]EDL59192.1 hypothetical protein PM8797T_23134 [Gimesia maris DSM 8797]